MQTHVLSQPHTQLLLTRAAFNAEANRPVDNTFHLVEKLLSVDSSALKDAKAAIYTPKLRGAIFLPNDAAVTQFIATLAVQLPTTGKCVMLWMSRCV